MIHQTDESGQTIGTHRRVGAREARSRFADLLGQVRYAHETVIIERAGEPVAALVPLEVVEHYTRARKRLFSIIDEIRSGLPDLPQDEVEADVAEAIAAVRAAKRNA